jgi:septum formation protein
MALILASTSPYRRALMERLGLPFRALAPALDEDSLKDPGLGPRLLTERLAEAKARSLVESEPEATIIGSDQVASLDGTILGKPGSEEGAVEQLIRMAGREHQLITSVCVLHRGHPRMHTDVTTLAMRTLSRDEIERYVAADRPIDCAGSYKLESRGITLFERIETQDSTAIVGLPLIALTSMLRELGFAIP